MQPTVLALLAVYHRVFANVTLTELCDIRFLSEGQHSVALKSYQMSCSTSVNAGISGVFCKGCKHRRRTPLKSMTPEGVVFIWVLTVKADVQVLRIKIIVDFYRTLTSSY